MALQLSSYNPKLIRSAPASFPPKVDTKEVTFVTKTIDVDWKYPKICKSWFSVLTCFIFKPLIFR